MKKNIMVFAGIMLLFLIPFVGSVLAEDEEPTDKPDLKQEMTELKNRIACLEKGGQSSLDNSNPLQELLSGINIAGGISAGSFYASNPGPDASDNEFLLSNFLVEFYSPEDGTLPVGFVGAFGETSTPSILDTPEINRTFDIEYASLILTAAPGISLEAGLMEPNAGLECTYSYNNKNIMAGAIASQQPYNAYGSRLSYEVDNLFLCAGYYKKRLDDEEYAVNESTPDDSWEIGLGGEVSDMEFSLYHYHIVEIRNLTGAFLVWNIGNMEMGVDVDYWHWDSRLKNDFEKKYSIGGAFYVCPRFKQFSIPVRLEYIDQGKSMIYIDSMDAKHIYTATVSPTYNFSETSYIRFESSYVDADNAFADKNGNSENNRICLAAEIGYLF